MEDGDIPEDWDAGYEITINKMNWRKRNNLIIHIVDACAHGEGFSKRVRHPDQGPLLSTKTIIWKKTNKDNRQFIEIYEFIRGDSKAVSENFHKLVIEAANQLVNPSYKFLKRLKQILHLENNLEKDEGDKKSLLFILDQK